MNNTFDVEFSDGQYKYTCHACGMDFVTGTVCTYCLTCGVSFHPEQIVRPVSDNTIFVQDPLEVRVSTREAIYIRAERLVAPVVETWGLAPLFVNNGVISPAQQHVDLIRDVADWLMRND